MSPAARDRTPDPAPEAAADQLPIARLLSAVMRSVGAVGKDSRNQQQGFSFRGVDAVVNAVHPALTAHGVVVVPHLDAITYETLATRNGGTVTSARAVVTYTFHGPAGDHIAATVAAEAFDSGDKATAKCMSVAFRTALLQSLTLPTDEHDPDGDTYERDAPRAQAPSVDPAALESAYSDVCDAVVGYPAGPQRDQALRALDERTQAFRGQTVTTPTAWGQQRTLGWRDFVLAARTVNLEAS